MGQIRAKGKEEVLIGNESDERITGLMGNDPLEEITELRKGHHQVAGLVEGRSRDMVQIAKSEDGRVMEGRIQR